MLRQNYRFHGHASLNYLFSHGAKVRTKYFSVRATLNPHRKTTRAAVIVSKKVLRHAVLRNQARRRLYELIRLHLDNWEQPVDLAISIYSADILLLKPQELEQQLLLAYHKLHKTTLYDKIIDDESV